MDFDYFIQVLQSMTAAVKKLFNIIDLIVRTKWDPVATPPPSATVQHPFTWPYPPWMDKLPTCLAGELTTCPFFAEVPSHPEFGLDLHDAGTAKEQVLAGLLDSLGLGDWESLHEMLSGSSNIPSMDITQLFPLILFVLSVCIIWLIIQEVLHTEDEGLLLTGAQRNARPPSNQPCKELGVDNPSCDLDAPPPTASRSDALRVSLEDSGIAEASAASEPASPSSSVEDGSMVSSDPKALSGEDEPRPGRAQSLSIWDNSSDDDFISPNADDVRERAPSSQATNTGAHHAPPTAPSFDVLGPLAAAPSALAVSLMDENLEESLSDDVLRSAGLITPVDSAAQVAEPDAQELTDGEPISVDAGDSVPPASGALGGENLGAAMANGPASQQLEICARLSVVEPEDTRSSSEGAVALNSSKSSPSVASGSSAVEVTTSASSSLPQDLPDYMPSDWSLVPPSSDLSDVVGERVTAEDWTTIKSYMAMQDDEENGSGLRRMTLIQECRPPLHFPDPCTLARSTTLVRNDDAEDPFCPRPTPQMRTLFRSGHQRAFSEPPPLSDPEWIRADVDPLPQLSATRARLDIFKDPRCPVLPTDADARFPLKSPELQDSFPSLAAQMGVILHSRSHARFAPRAEAGRVVKEEQAALRLAALPELRRRHSTAGFGAPMQGLSKAAFLRMYIPYIRDQLSYAEVTGAGVTPWGRVVPMGAPESPSPTGNSLNLRKIIEVNRNRGGQDVSMFGADMKAEYTRPLPPLRRVPGLPLARTPPRMPIASASEQSPSPARSRQRTASVSTQRLPSFISSVQGDLRRASSFQSNAPSRSPSGGAHARSHSESPLASTPSRRTRFASPVLSPIPSSPSPPRPAARAPSLASRGQSLLARRTSAAALPRLAIGGRPRGLDPVAGSPPKGAPTTALTPVHSAVSSVPSLDAIAATVGGGAGAKAYPRIDDEGALARFEVELGVVGDA
ncbi:hypothetical protein PsYK624_152990 [Phanerochaete sordida]|uniref:Uncharacterized protein n=1 Tax=Phanerochaete sordida TaxID=48140 RepID=A0A9P3GRK2_9APHY|nr:hypothetical protein PsYK624_152990 [Phanerochaete sordida]